MAKTFGAIKSAAAISGRPRVMSALLLLPSVTNFAVQFPGVPRSLASSPLASPPSFCALLPVWPSS